MSVKHCMCLGQDVGDRLLVFRSGCAITLALSDVELKITEIMDHIGWNRRHTALHYLQLGKVLNPSGAYARLASSEVMSVNNTWTDLNALKRFFVRFQQVLHLRDHYQTDKQDYSHFVTCTHIIFSL